MRHWATYARVASDRPSNGSNGRVLQAPLQPIPAAVQSQGVFRRAAEELRAGMAFMRQMRPARVRGEDGVQLAPQPPRRGWQGRRSRLEQDAPAAGAGPAPAGPPVASNTAAPAASAAGTRRMRGYSRSMSAGCPCV